MTALVEISAHARKLQTGPHRLAPIAALCAAAEHVRSEMYMPVGDERVPFTVLEAAGGGKRSIDVDVGGTRWTMQRGREAVSADDTTLLVELVPVGEAGAPIPAKGTVQISVDSAPLLEYDYDLGEVRAALPPLEDTRQDWVYRLPLQGAAATDDAVDKKLALVELELRGAFKRDKRGRVGIKLSTVAVRVISRPIAERAPMAAPASSTGLEPRMPVQPPPVPPRTDEPELRAAAADLTAGDTTASVYIVRTGGRALFEHGSAAMVELGEATRALSAAAVVAYVLKHTETSRLSEIVLNDRAEVGRLLDASGATHVHEALRNLYARSGATMPSLIELLSDMAGLPTYAPHTTHDQHALVADSGGRPASGDVERDFAAVLDKSTLVAAPGAVYHPSALGWAVLLFALPGWERNADVVRMLAELAGTEHGAEIAWPSAPNQPGFQSIYRLWAGMRASPAAVAHMLSHVGWFGATVGVEFDWLHVLLGERAPITPRLAAASGGWMRIVTPDGHRILAAAGTYDNTTTVLAVSPALGLSGIYVERSGAASAHDIAHRMARFMARLAGKPTVPALARVRATRPSVAAAAAAYRAAALLAASTNPKTQLPELQRHFSGTFVAVNEPATTLSIAVRATPPDQKQRAVLTLQRGAETAEFILAYDPDAPPNPADAGGMRGAMRLIDPLTHAVGDAVYFEMVQGANGRQEPIVYALGRVFSRASYAEETRAHFDATSDVAQRRALAAAEKAAADKAAVEQRRAARRQQKMSVIKDGEQSDDESGDEAGVSDDDEPSVEPLQLRIGDMYDALATTLPLNTARTQYGRWHAYIGTDRNRGAAMVHAYPAGGRAYPLGTWTSGAPTPYYLQ